MSDRSIAVLAALVWCAALVPIGRSQVWLVVPLLAAVFAWRSRRPRLLIIAAAAMASLGAGAALASIEPAPSQTFVGEALLVSDPLPVQGGLRVRAEIGEYRYDLRAWGSSAGRLRGRLMGERVEIEARLRPLEDPPRWLITQGLSGRGTVTAVAGFDVGRPHTRLANSIRRTIESGARSLGRDEQALFAGLVYGDDRLQSPLTADNFNAAGLTHLLAVSGQNVAFTLSIAGPVLRRLGHRQRFVFVLGVLLLFATVTRFEASVVRASVMAAVAAVASLIGTEVSGRRLLCLAVTALVLIDPLIVHSIAFQLSVAASAGILAWSARVARALPGPRPVIEALSVTCAAQLAVAPLLLWRFDGLPVASLPANLLAAPAAGPVMMWGLTAGLVAGLVPAAAATVLHLPTRAAVWWIDAVAGAAPEVPLGRLGAAHVVLLFVLAAVGLRQHQRALRVAAMAGVVAVLAHPAIALAAAPSASQIIDEHSTIFRDELVTVVELDARSRPEAVLAALRRANVGDIDLIIVRQATYNIASQIGWIRSHHEVAQVWSPNRSLGVGETRPLLGARLLVDGLILEVASTDDQLLVTATRPP